MAQSWYVQLAWFLFILLAGMITGNLLRRWWDGLGGVQARDTARRWWHSGLAAPPKSLGIRRRDGAIEQVRPVRVSGLHLVVEPLFRKQRTWEMMSAGDAADPGEFWRVWKFYGGRSSGWIDEDGDEFIPGS